MVEGDKIMFRVDKELKSANIARTIRFTEPLFERLNNNGGGKQHFL